jgi:hypothetical protein
MFPYIKLWIANTTTTKGRWLMSQNNEYDDEFDDFGDEGTDVVKQLRKVNRTLEKRAKELEQELKGLQSQTRQRTVKDVLQAKGINPKIAAFIPQDIDTSEDAINGWLSEYGDVFGVNSNANSEQASNNSVDVSANARINQVVSTGQVPEVDSDAMAKILAAGNADELNRILGLN